MARIARKLRSPNTRDAMADFLGICALCVILFGSLHLPTGF